MLKSLRGFIQRHVVIGFDRQYNTAGIFSDRSRSGLLHATKR